MPDSPAIDVNQLRKTFDDDTVLAELYTLYLADTTKRLDELRAAVAANDAQRCNRIAHAMKGSSANVGANEMRAIAAQLEKHDWATEPTGAQTLGAALHAEFFRVRAFIEEFLAACPCAC